jgi:transposase
MELSKMEQRYEAVLGVIRDGLQVTEVAEALGVGRQTVHVWLARYEAEGLAGLEERSDRPKASSWQLVRPQCAPMSDGRRHDLPEQYRRP